MKQLLILSGKGGTGKTTIASNFIRFSQARVFADCDVEAPNLHLLSLNNNLFSKEDYYGLDKVEIDQDICVKCGLCFTNCKFNAISFLNGEYNINKYLCEGCGVCEYICPHKAISFVKSIDGEVKLYKENTVFSTATLKMGSGNSGLLVTKVKKQMVKDTTENDLVIIDGPPGIGCPVIASMSGVDMVLLVAEPSESGISDLMRIIKTANNFRIRIAVCINKCDLNETLTQKIIDYLEANKHPYVGKISYNNKISKFLNANKPIDESIVSYKEIRAVYEETLRLLFKQN